MYADESYPDVYYSSTPHRYPRITGCTSNIPTPASFYAGGAAAAAAADDGEEQAEEEEERRRIVEGEIRRMRMRNFEGDASSSTSLRRKVDSWMNATPASHRVSPRSLLLPGTFPSAPFPADPSEPLVFYSTAPFPALATHGAPNLPSSSSSSLSAAAMPPNTSGSSTSLTTTHHIYNHHSPSSSAASLSSSSTSSSSAPMSHSVPRLSPRWGSAESIGNPRTRHSSLSSIPEEA